MIRIEKHLQCENLLGLAGKHQKAWKLEIRREHNSNPLRHTHSHVHFREMFYFASSFPRYLVVFQAFGQS